MFVIPGSPSGTRAFSGPFHSHFLKSDNRIPAAGILEEAGARRLLSVIVDAGILN